MPKSEVPTQDELPIWALQLISRVHELETKVVDLQQIIDDCRSTCCRCCPSDSHQERADPGSKTTVQITVQSTDNCIDVDGNNNYKATQGEHVVQRMNNLKEELPDKVPLPMAKRAMVHTNEDIHRNATRNLARAIQSRIQEDPKKQQLTEAYDYLNKQITMNETAIEDALDYIKAIKSVDGAMAVEQHGQIMELVVSINKEKERRESALAALIFYNFAEKQDTLRSLLNEEILGTK
ncbi:LOW QUALITY PROTEIN: hypothetical protein PHPALM_27866 [Phytophthora palmivora]|uniref:Uncharacterized protein n=1 Tax=Phytophthora palmivora TaxID=4796 RepID=A0A2P4XBK1_9STRA|nr:LOW QUALITY PROTEIN: hypothetical protein PHPALM_27866 [Phytophthora palmivora]